MDIAKQSELLNVSQALRAADSRAPIPRSRSTLKFGWSTLKFGWSTMQLGKYSRRDKNFAHLNFRISRDQKTLNNHIVYRIF